MKGRLTMGRPARASRKDARVFYRDTKPYEAPLQLAELCGPSAGQVELPLNVYWGPPHIFDLNNESDIVEAYQATLREGRVEDQAKILNADLLVSIWADLQLPVRVRRLWEERFQVLATMSGPAHPGRLAHSRSPRELDLI
jgi:hypothetical protein